CKRPHSRECRQTLRQAARGLHSRTPPPRRSRQRPAPPPHLAFRARQPVRIPRAPVEYGRDLARGPSVPGLQGVQLLLGGRRSSAAVFREPPSVRRVRPVPARSEYAALTSRYIRQEPSAGIRRGFLPSV